MKKLLTTITLLALLLVIGFSGIASGQDPPISGQIFEQTKRTAEQGKAISQWGLGVLYWIGRGVPQNNVLMFQV